MRYLIIFLILQLPIWAQQEWRAFWVDAWNEGIFNEEQVKSTVMTAQQNGYNAIVIQVRRRGDAIYFPTYPNTEPRVGAMPENFDALQAFVEYAHKYKLEVHAWITTFLISTSTPPKATEHVFNRHPEYLMQDYSGEKKIVEGYYLDPGNPAALEWNKNVVLDLVKNYDIDGFHFDYVRYPAKNSGYNPVAIQRYNEEYGLSGKPHWEDQQFATWRRRQITDWIRKMYVTIFEIKPHLKVTAATFADRYDAFNYRFQDWSLWMQEGILDANLPMNYTKDNKIFQERTDDILRHSHGRHVYMGLGAYLLSPQQTLEQLLYAREKNGMGMVFFSYANNNGQGKSIQEVYQYFKNNAFAIPAEIPEMSWKTNPQHGFISGVVKTEAGLLPIYNAVLKISGGKREIQSDVTGHYAFTQLTPGIYEIVCQTLGRQQQSHTVEVTVGKVTQLDFLLHEE